MLKRPIMDRRRFCKTSLTAAAGFPFLGMIGPAAAAARGRGVIKVELDLTLLENFVLNVIGGAKYVTHAAVDHKIIVVRTSETEAAAFSSKCTHQGCQVGLPQNDIITCPCHGSQFDNTGKVLGGQATTDLPAYTTTLQNNIITIELPDSGILPEDSRTLDPAGYVIENRLEKLVITSRGNLPPAAVKVYSLAGTCLAERECTKAAPAEIPKAGLAAGTCLVKLGTAAGSRVYRLVILR